MSKSRSGTKPANAFAGLGDILAGGFDRLLSSEESEITISLDVIEVLPQVREEFEDDENSLADLGRSLRQRQIQPIVVRRIEGRAQPYQLVAGERRLRAARLEGLASLRARVFQLSDEEAEDVQLAENIHRKNLTQIEEARKIQRDLDRLGSVEAVLERHKKSRAWLSKTLSLLNLPDQTKRLVSESISADLEVINTVKTIERADPDRARALVDELKETRGKSSARARVTQVREEVKPRPSGKAVPVIPQSASDGAPGIPVASGSSGVPREAKPAGSHVDVLSAAFFDVFERGKPALGVLNAMGEGEREPAERFLSGHHHAGVASIDPAREVISGLRSGRFAVDGAQAYALIAFLRGVGGERAFDFLEILSYASDRE